MTFSPASRARLQASLAFAGAILLCRRRGGAAWSIVLGIAGMLALLAWLSPTRYAPIQRALDALTRLLLGAFTWLILGVIYFGLFAPWRLCHRVLHRSSLPLRPDPRMPSYFQPLPSATRRRFDRQF